MCILKFKNATTHINFQMSIGYPPPQNFNDLTTSIFPILLASLHSLSFLLPLFLFPPEINKSYSSRLGRQTAHVQEVAHHLLSMLLKIFAQKKKTYLDLSIHQISKFHMPIRYPIIYSIIYPTIYTQKESIAHAIIAIHKDVCWGGESLVGDI